jgi:hypothetical protein
LDSGGENKCAVGPTPVRRGRIHDGHIDCWCQRAALESCPKPPDPGIGMPFKAPFYAKTADLSMKTGFMAADVQVIET